MAYAQCIASDGMYITAVATAPSDQKRGYATALLRSLRQQNAEIPALLLCKPALRRFYEKRGWRLVHPLCEYRRCTNAEL
jgi:predicted acetyltransferase